MVIIDLGAIFPAAYTWLSILALKYIMLPSIDSLVQDCSSSSASALELLQSCNKLSVCPW